jgi:hypothetical protein
LFLAGVRFRLRLVNGVQLRLLKAFLHQTRLMEYYFNELSPTSFQRLINGILVARFGTDIRLTPLRGADGGRDGETAPGNPFFEFSLKAPPGPSLEGVLPPRPGRYLFQVKHHFTGASNISDARQAVVTDFSSELNSNVLRRTGNERVNYFILITNIPSSRDSIAAVDRARKKLHRRKSLHADVWWKERVDAELDQLPNLWASFPEMFAGGRVPMLAKIAAQSTEEPLPRGVRVALQRQYTRDSNVKFRQIELERDLAKLFVDLDISLEHLSPEDVALLRIRGRTGLQVEDLSELDRMEHETYASYSALALLLSEGHRLTSRIILEGGPGQGKSTITQMTAQIYRQQILGRLPIDPENRWLPPEQSRLPFRIELRNFGDWLTKQTHGTVEGYLAHLLTKDSGGSSIGIDEVQELVTNAPVILIFDGLDEVGSDDLRDTVLDEISGCIDRFETGLGADVRAVVTTRPPAIAGRGDRLVEFRRFPISTMRPDRINSYVDRWLAVQVIDPDDRERVRSSFQARREEPHVAALAKNPMQLSVLLHFIRLKGEAFPDRRAELYRDYFQIVIDRDVEKSTELRSQRDMIESLHQFLGYKIHALTEAERADGTLTRQQLLALVSAWLLDQGHDGRLAASIFKLGEERLGLIVTLKGEGEETRYGYEIQPIREYFAAAFFNHEIVGDAHEIFQELVRRPFWREVALFLAGLRRRNERADLIARAKKIDEHPELGWRQDGRSITFQLVQEGVLAQPPHVCSEAVDYLVEIVDPEKVPVQPEMRELRRNLPLLIKQVGVDRYKTQIIEIIERYNRCRGAIWARELYIQFSTILSHDELLSLLLSYECESPRARAEMQFRWAAYFGVDLNVLIKRGRLWEQIPPVAAGASIWIAASQHPSVTAMSFPSNVHLYLLEQYAFGVFNFNSREQDGPSFNLPVNAWAAWFLIECTTNLAGQGLFSSQHLAGEVRQNLIPSLEREIKPSVEGLPADLAETVLAVLPMMRELTRTVLHQKREIIKVLRDYLPAAVDLLRKPGLSGWLAYRSVVYAFRALIIEQWPARAESEEREIARLSRFLSANDRFQEVWNLICDLSGRPGEETIRRIRSSTVVYDALPLQVRLPNGRLDSILDLIVQHHLDGAPYVYEWLGRLDLPRDAVHRLLECRFDRLSELMTLVPRFRSFLPIGGDLRVSTQSRERLLALARDSDDPTVLRGALEILVDAQFEGVAGVDLVEKLVRIGSSETDLAARLFMGYRLRRIRGSSKQSEALLELATRILRNPDGVRFGIVTAAATYVTEHAPINLSPLLVDEERLGIRCSTVA